MSSDINMSLEDIIKKKKRDNKRTKNLKPKTAISQAMPITDARNKIISKKRVQFTDARERLAELAKQKDARLKLEQLRLRNLKTSGNLQRNKVIQNHGKVSKILPYRERVFTNPSRLVTSQPLGNSKRRQNTVKRFTGNRSVGTRVIDQFYRPAPIVRTIENDLEIIDEPMEEDNEPPKTTFMNRKANMQLKIVAHNNDVWDNIKSTAHRTAAIAEVEKSPPRPASILKKRPMASLRTEKEIPKPLKSVLEYRIIVSNLRNTVTGGDIEELFGDVGGMLESRLVRPGTAEVIYKSQEDAQRAVDLYHNRQLDGQPMNCLLVTPRSTSAPSRSNSSTKPALYSTNSNVEPDISTFHKVLFSNL